MATQFSHNPRGYPKAIFVDRVDEKYFCAECKLVLRDARQSSCGHRFCNPCILEIQRQIQTNEIGPNKPCQACLAEHIDDSFIVPTEMFPDRAVQKEIGRKTVKCPNLGCNEQMMCKLYDEHESNCPHKPLICEQCFEPVQRPNIEQHKKKECRARPVKCKYCGQSFQFSKMEEHNTGCPKYPVTCDFCHKKLIREQLTVHVTTSCQAQSQRVTLAKVNELLDLRLQPLRGASGGVSPDVNSQLQMYEHVLAVLKEDIIKLINTVQAHEERGNLLMAKLEQQSRMLALKDIALAEQELRLNSLELTSYDGTLMWKITDVQKKRDDAISQRAVSVYSPAFYTSRTGYKMCARLYLNGDGMGKNSHVSMFFVIMRGHYDALLKWPFRQKVTFMLIDQNQKEHVIDAFRPDPNSSSFKCPTSEMNIASGCPLFVPISHLDSPVNAYIRNDTMFMKIIVDCSDLC